MSNTARALILNHMAFHLNLVMALQHCYTLSFLSNTNKKPQRPNQHESA